jgi:pSer/pThr/pTyr-binding forkhead associated (FHA) protein
VQVVSDTVSRTHALIWQEAGAAWVADLDSSNGTYLNGTRISDPAAIVSGDVVTFGDVGFTIREP